MTATAGCSPPKMWMSSPAHRFSAAPLGDRSSVVGGVVSELHADIWNPDDLAVLRVEHTSPLAVPLPPATFAQSWALRVASRVTVAGWGARRLGRNRVFFPHKLTQYVGGVPPSQPTSRRAVPGRRRSRRPLALLGTS